MSFGFGISAALASPLVMTIGFVFWQNHWKGSAFALNLYKCTLASVAFLVVVLCMSANDDAEDTPSLRSRSRSLATFFPSDTFTQTTVGYLFLSSTIGIVVGDVLWLQALQYLGARRVIFVDSLKPFVAALLGYVVLDEEIRLAALGGIVVTVLGIILVSLEKEADNSADDNGAATVTSEQQHQRLPTDSTAEDAKDGLSAVELATRPLNAADSTTMSCPTTLPAEIRQSNDTKSSHTRILAMGYAMSLMNVVLDTYGAVLTKEHGVGLTVWEINLLRFGFAAVVMIVVSTAMMVFHALESRCRFRRSSSLLPNGSDTLHSTESTNSKVAVGEVAPQENDDDDEDTKAIPVGSPTTPPVRTCPWYALPLKHDMTSSSWMHVSMGVALVTFLAASLSNYALFNIALALTLTLTSIGPLYALPLTYWMSEAKHRQPITVRAVGGALLTVVGIAILAFWGRKTQ